MSGVDCLPALISSHGLSSALLSKERELSSASSYKDTNLMVQGPALMT